MRGLQGSWKSTYAKTLADKWYKRVGKDDLRLMLDNKQFDKKKEKFVEEVELSIIDIALREGYNVVIDDTNASMKRIDMLLRLFGNMEYSDRLDVRVEQLWTPLEECIERDSKRWPAMVGKEVIMKFYNDHFKEAYESMAMAKPVK